MIVIVMGVSGVGKSTVGRRLAQELGFEFADADDFHPPSNVRKMARNIPLTDADRWPWLRRMARQIARWRREGLDVVLACSALKLSYRHLLTGGQLDVRLVYLRGDREIIRERLQMRRGHFMLPGLLESQLTTLEPPILEENAIEVGTADPPEAIVATVRARLGLPQARAERISRGRSEGIGRRESNFHKEA
jgi:carbohydrate kinase (thermoresistant glucokinase family)